MNVYQDHQQPPGRYHLWTYSETTPANRYYDFRLNPKLIREILEDFRPWEKFEAVQSFYKLLTWLNGPDSNLETNDCGLRPPEANNQPQFPWSLVVHARLTVFSRELVFNTVPKNIALFRKKIEEHLRDKVPQFPACIAIGTWATLFTEIGQEGEIVTLEFWSWGNKELEAMSNLNLAFQALTTCLLTVSEMVGTVSRS